MNTEQAADWLAANGFGYLSIDAPEPGDDHNPHVIVLGHNISVLVYEKLGTAQAVRRDTVDGQAPKILDPTETYLGIVSQVKSLAPKRGAGQVLQGPWDI